jgi:tetratricopeptide (TPR) repeat protein
MKKIILGIFVLILSSSLFAQKKETVKNNGTTNNISISPVLTEGTGTDSEIAREYFDKAYEFGNNNDLVNAEKFYKKALEEDENFIKALDNLGLTYRKMKKYDMAIEYYNKSISLKSNGITAHQNLASVYNILKKYDDAIIQYEEILKIEPNNPEGYFGLANCYMMTSKFDRALINSEKATEIYIETESHYINEGYYLSGLISYYSGNKIQAKEYFILTKKHGGKINAKLEKELFSD